MPEHLSFDERVNRIEAITGRRFNNKTLLQEALTMAGGPIQPPCRNNGQKSLALVGDAVLSLVLVMEGYQRGYEGGETPLCPRRSLFFFFSFISRKVSDPVEHQE